MSLYIWLNRWTFILFIVYLECIFFSYDFFSSKHQKIRIILAV